MKAFLRRAVKWIEQLKPQTFGLVGYIPLDKAEAAPDLNFQLEEILACVRHEELKWRITDRIRAVSRRPRRGDVRRTTDH